MERANSQLCTRVKQKAKPLLSSLSCALPFPSSSSAVKISNFDQSPISNSGPENCDIEGKKNLFWWMMVLRRSSVEQWRFGLLKSPSGDGLVCREQVIRLKVHNDCSLSLGYQQCGHAYVFLGS